MNQYKADHLTEINIIREGLKVIVEHDIKNPIHEIEFIHGKQLLTASIKHWMNYLRWRRQ